MKKLIVGCACALIGCGTPESIAENSVEVESVNQAATVGQGNVNQGNVNQGNVNQGNVNQGAALGVMVVNRGSFNFRTGASQTHVYPKLSGSQLGGTTSSGSTLWLPTSSTAWPPLATFGVQKMDQYGSIVSPLKNMRIIGISTDSGNYGAGDAVNMLAPAYRPSSGPILSTVAKTAPSVVIGPIGWPTASPNADIVFYQTQILADNGTWQDFCPTAPGRPPNAAVFTEGYFDPTGAYRTTNTQYMGIACWDGTAVKCMRWGYKPWKSLTPTSGGPAVPLKNLYTSCTRAAMADYCGNNTSYTQPETRIDLWDAYGFIPKSPMGNAWTNAQGEALAFSAESAFDPAGAVCVVRERLYQINMNEVSCPSTFYFNNGSATCTNGNPSLPPGSWSSCGPKGTVVRSGYIFERGKLNDCVVNAVLRTSRTPLVYAASWTSACNHSPNSTGATLGSDCNCITTSVCQKPGYRPDWLPWSKCCEMDANGHQIQFNTSGQGWNQYCKAEADWLASRPFASCSLSSTQMSSQ